MTTNKMREEFVTWLESLGVGYDVRFADFMGGLGDGEFYDAEVQGLWTTWQASRAVLVIDLPKGDSLARRMFGPQACAANPLISRFDAVEAIEAVGLKVKP